MTALDTRAVDQDQLAAFLGHALEDLGATFGAGMVVLGDRLGLYQAMADGAGLTAVELAERTGTAAAYVTPWLSSQAAGGYVTYDPETQTYAMTPEQSAALADEGGPAFFPDSMQLALGVLRDLPAIEARFRDGRGFGWHEHDAGLFEGTERFFRPGYAANLVSTWLPSLDGVVDRLDAGATVADLGCGHGASTILMAQAFPNSTFLGTDYHEASIRTARRRAEEAGVADRVRFEVAESTEISPASYDLITMFDCLHDMGDPAAAATAVRRGLRADGTFMLVEPAAGDHVEDNLHAVGRVFYGASVLICTPCSLAQPGGRALGPQAGPAVLTQLLNESGFSRVRVATQSPVNLVLEARI